MKSFVTIWWIIDLYSLSLAVARIGAYWEIWIDLPFGRKRKFNIYLGKLSGQRR